MFFREIDGRRFSYPVPGGRDVLRQYVRGVRRRFRLTDTDGVDDNEFYSR